MPALSFPTKDPSTPAPPEDHALNRHATDFHATAERGDDEDDEALTPPPADPYNGIDPARIAELTRQACQRLADCRSEMGLDLGGGGYSPIGREGTWAWIRQCARFEYAGNFNHRRALGGVFGENNWSMNLPARFVDQRAARHQDDLVGTSPFMATMPEQLDDPRKVTLSKQVETKVQREIARSNVQEVLRESIRVALAEGERAIKFGWNVEETTYTGPATGVMIDTAGKPLRTPKGRLVFKKDDVIDILVDARTGRFVGPYPDPTQPPPPGLHHETRLEAEPAFVMPPHPRFADFDALEQTLGDGARLEADGLFCEDFIYPITVPRLELADIMAHVYDTPLENLRAYYRNAGYESRLAQQLSGSGPQSQQAQPILDQGEQQRATLHRELICIHETYYRCRVHPDDAKESWLFLVIDYSHGLCVYADYLGNMKIKKPPFILLRGLKSVPGRAYGVGIYQDFRDKCLAYDMWFNRLALKNSKDGSVTFVHRDGTEETRDGHELIIGDRKQYHIPAGSEYGKERPPVFRENLNEADEFCREMMEMVAQSGELSYGIVSAADGSAENLNASGTATGINNIERTGNLLQSPAQGMMADDIERGLEIMVDLILENMDDEEVQWLPDQNALATLNREDIRNNLPRDVRLLLTKARSAESMQINQQVKSTILEYYGLSKMLQKKVRSTYVAILKDLEVPDADEKLQEPTDDEIAQETPQGPPGQQGLPPTPPGPRESIAINYKDAPPDIQRQMEQAAGFQPSPGGSNQFSVPSAQSNAAPTPQVRPPGPAAPMQQMAGAPQSWTSTPPPGPPFRVLPATH